MQLTSRQLATVLAALRYWQREGWISSGHEHDIASDGDMLEPLTAEEIDALCEDLNCDAPDLIKTTLAPDIAAAKAAGFATWNQGPHLCVEIPDGASTITCRTSQGRLVTFSFVNYETGGPPQCVDIHEATGPALEFDGRVSRLQRIVAFGKGPTIFRANPKATERKDAVTLTTLIISPP